MMLVAAAAENRRGADGVFKQAQQSESVHKKYLKDREMEQRSGDYEVSNPFTFFAKLIGLMPKRKKPSNRSERTADEAKRVSGRRTCRPTILYCLGYFCPEL